MPLNVFWRSCETRWRSAMLHSARQVTTMLRTLVAAIGLATLLGVSPTQAGQTAIQDQGVQSELLALRQSVERIASLLEQLVQHAARRDTAQLLVSRIEIAERRVGPFLAELDRLRAVRESRQAQRLTHQQALASVDAMEQTDRSGSNVAAFQAERQRIAGLIAGTDAELFAADGQIARLEAEIATRRQAIDAMDAELARLAGGG